MIYDAIIIGAGLGGLQCGYVLAKKGMNVCVIEKEKQMGGCIQTFRRAGATFDTGFHYVGGMDKGQALHNLMKYFDLLDLPWHRLDDEGFDEIIMGNKSYMFKSGHERFLDTMLKNFPHEEKNLKEYVSFLQTVGTHVFNIFKTNDTKQLEFHNSLFSESAYGYMQSQFEDPFLIQVLSGASMKMEPHPEKLPLYTFAQTNESYIESSWRLKGGGSKMSDKLVENIRNMGGTVLAGQEVTELKGENGQITTAILKNGECIEGKNFISNVHPAVTLKLLSGSGLVRSSYTKRIVNLENTFGMFSVNIKLKEGTLPYLNRNLHIHTEPNVWSNYQYDPKREGMYVFASYSVPERDPHFAETIDLLLPMYWEEVSQWENTTVGRRGQDYKEFKEKKAEEAIALVAQHIPGLREAIDKYYTSTPLTWRDYTGTVHGSAYGIRKDYNNLAYTVLSSMTPVSNLLLTGQNLSVHGIMGVSMTSVLTCARMLGEKEVFDDFHQS